MCRRALFVVDDDCSKGCHVLFGRIKDEDKGCAKLKHQMSCTVGRAVS